MNKREFNKLLKLIADKKTHLLDLNKIPVLLTDEQRRDMVKHLVRYRCPIVKELIPDEFDWGWLHSCAYLHTTKGKHFTFVHTDEQRIVSHRFLFE